MSHENVELARQAFDAFNRRYLGAYLALMDADMEAGSLLAALEADYRGHAGIRRWWRSCGTEAQALDAAGLRE